MPGAAALIGSLDESRWSPAGYPDSAIMEILGWSSMAMLRRYLGEDSSGAAEAVSDDVGAGVRSRGVSGSMSGLPAKILA